MNFDSEFNHNDLGIERRETLYQGFFKVDGLHLKHKTFADGEIRVRRELFIRGDAVAAILYDPDHSLIALIDQFRVGALRQADGPWCLEVVAGMIDTDESPLQVIEREMREEANIVAKRLDYIGNYLSTPGGTDETIYLFCAICDLSKAGGIHGLDSEGEDIRVNVFDADKLLADLYAHGLNGHRRYNNAATLISLQWLYFQRTQGYFDSATTNP